MADYSCEWCNKQEEKDCRYAYGSTECEPRQLLDLYEAFSKEEYQKVLEFVEFLKTKEESSDYVKYTLQAINDSIIRNYPEGEELEYIKELLK